VYNFLNFSLKVFFNSDFKVYIFHQSAKACPVVNSKVCMLFSVIFISIELIVLFKGLYFITWLCTRPASRILTRAAEINDNMIMSLRDFND